MTLFIYGANFKSIDFFALRIAQNILTTGLAFALKKTTKYRLPSSIFLFLRLPPKTGQLDLV